MILKLIRDPLSPLATTGILYTTSGTYFTIERPWLDNARGISCFPEGTYPCRKRWSNHFKRNLYGIFDVEGRGDILIHNGSYPQHSQGCLLIGKTKFVLDGKPGIGLSKVAISQFHSEMDFTPFTLIVTRRQS